MDPYRHRGAQGDEGRRSRSHEPFGLEPIASMAPNFDSDFEEGIAIPWPGSAPAATIDPSLIPYNVPAINTGGINSSHHALPWNHGGLIANTCVFPADRATRAHLAIGNYDPRFNYASAPATPSNTGMLAPTMTSQPNPHGSGVSSVVATCGQGANSSNNSRKSASPFAYTPTSSQEDALPSMQSPTKEYGSSRPPRARKRRLDEMQTSFRVNQEEARPRRRAPLSREGRQGAAQARQVGSCARCRIRKVRFNLPRPCDHCTRFAHNDYQLAGALCLSETLEDIRFGGFDLLFELHTENFVKEEVVRYVGLSKHIDLVLLHDRESKKVVPLTVEVRRYSPEGSEGELPYHTVAVDDNNFREVPSDRYAIIPESIPSVDEILDWVQMDLSAAEGVAVQRLIIALARFMTEYCDSELQLPCSELLASTTKILKLLRCWRSAKMLASGAESYASKAVASQILIVVKKGIWEQEQFVLKKLEMIYKTQVPDRKSLVPLWACLWSLILMYRDCMKVYTQYSAAPREREGKRKPGTVYHKFGINTCQRMYEILTAYYAALFEVQLPLYMDWRMDENFDLLGQSESLRESFYELRDEVELFYDSSEELGSEDKMLKEMIIDKELKMRPPRLPSSRSTTTFSSNHG